MTNQYDSTATPENRRKRGRPKKSEVSQLVHVETPDSARNVSWAAIHSLKGLELDPSLATLFSSHKQKIEGILIGGLALSDDLQPQASRAGASDTERLVHICHSVQISRHLLMIDKLRWIFLVLMVGDMQHALFGSRASLGKVHEQEIQRVLDQQSQAVGSPDTISVVLNFKDMSKILQAGLNLSWLCEELGVGCIFFLWSMMSHHL